MRKLAMLALLFVANFIGMAFVFAGNDIKGMEDILSIPECKYCGMRRSSFAHSRMLLERDNIGRVGTCSLNCTAVDYMSDMDHLPSSIQVGDYRSKRIIDAEKAYWVIGGNKSGVMTERAKWAFEKKRDADTFIRRHGGVPATFEEAVRASYVDMYKEMKLGDRQRILQHHSRLERDSAATAHP